ncbi:hypothetical protein [Caminicella sporogenes]|uniref:hypothetical protein n=1 Tax=Caminicella sporogenes TaxID=166485 RepID=UPI0025420A64|nr:hypothetical protein [Caminicella sporogenes]WIF94453.1 hypothetical protein QNI18_09300 [Caminicella sporogenes]
MSNRMSERDLIPLALYVIKNTPGIDTSELIDELIDIYEPQGEDAEILSNRNDSKFSQKVRNLKSHNTLTKLGFAEYRNGSWYITEEGELFLNDIIKQELKKYRSR